jgi:hypothetical protein
MFRMCPEGEVKDATWLAKVLGSAKIEEVGGLRSWWRWWW